MAVFEGRWRCPSCGGEQLGRHESCQDCGMSRPADVRFYLPGNEPAVTDAAQLDDAASGADWYCDHCGGANPNRRNGATIISCAHCGQARDAGDTDHKITTYGLGRAPRTADEARPSRKTAAAEKRLRANHGKRSIGAVRERIRAPAATRMPRQMTRKRIGAFVAALIVVLALVLSFFLPIGSREVVVSQSSWSKSIDIEVIKTFREGAWDVPAGGRLVSTEIRQRTTRQVLDHYVTKSRQVRYVSGSESYACGTTDNGNGYFSTKYCSRPTYSTRSETYQDPVYRTEPVMDSWETYDIDRWTVIRSPATSGHDARDPWPEIVLEPGEREGTRRASYTLTLMMDEDTPVDKTVSRDSWARYLPGTFVRVRTTLWGRPVGAILPEGGSY